MAFTLEDKWLWDSWFVHDGEEWHGYFLQAPKTIADPEQRHWHVSYHHATSDDLINWNSLGTCFKPSDGPAWDDGTTWTGSVVCGDDGKWHLYYTGTSKSENYKKQRIGHAVSDDLHNWQRVGDGQILDIDDRYEEFIEGRWHDRAFRDPFVFKNPDGEDWLMVFTARDPNVADTMEAGAIGFARSNDLYKWQLEDPLFVGGAGELEVPQILKVGNKWICLFCTSARYWGESAVAAAGPAKTGTHYLMSDHVTGPWEVAPGPVLDGADFAHNYAGRIIEDQNKLKLMRFRWFEEAGGEFVGNIPDPEIVEITADGLLRVGQAT